MTDERVICPLCSADITTAVSVAGTRVTAWHGRIHIDKFYLKLRDAVLRGSIEDAQNIEEELAEAEHRLKEWLGSDT